MSTSCRLRWIGLVASLSGLSACTSASGDSAKPIDSAGPVDTGADTSPRPDTGDSSEDTSRPETRPAGVWLTETADLRNQRILAINETYELVANIPIWQDLPEGWPEETPPPLLSDFQLLEDGGLLLALNGYGLQRLDATGALVWEHLDQEVSHDADMLPDGNVLYARGWADKGEDLVREVDADGATVWSWTGIAAYENDPRFASVGVDGWAHVNSVNRLADGRTGVCARNFNAMITLDTAGAVTDEFTFDSPDDTLYAQTDGTIPGERPHACEWRTDGSVTVGLREPHIAMILSADRSVEWQWSPPGISGIKDVDRLSNGNTLVSGREAVMQADAEGNVVWEWLSGTWDGDTLKDTAAGRLPHFYGPVVVVGADGSITDSD